ncbi:carbohydrate ABC transporter permease, partial [Rhizobium ruizarguesonis]
MNHSAPALVAAHAKPRRKARLRYSTLRKLVPYFYVSPATLLLVLLMLFPMVMVFKYSLMDGAIMKKDAAFAGVQNYLTIFENPVFWQSVVQTLYFTIMSVVFHFIIGLAFALLLNTNRVDPLIRSILRVLFILPWLFTAVIIAIIWRLLLDPNGVVNSVLMALHIINFKVEWFSSTR